jgi:hypothetical protein
MCIAYACRGKWAPKQPASAALCYVLKTEAAALITHRQSLIGGELEALMCRDEDASDTSDLLAGLLLLLHLCSPAQYGVDTAAAACAALAALLADGCSVCPRLSPVDVHEATDAMIAAHSSVSAAAMRHEGLAAKLAQQRPDAITLLAAAAY